MIMSKKIMSKKIMSKKISVWFQALCTVLFFLDFLIQIALADEFRPLFRGARAQAMGNAFTAVADDEEALFYNPAGLAGIEKFSFTLVSASADVSNNAVSNYSTFEGVASNPSITSLNNLIGQDLYARGTGMAALTFPGFEVAGIYDQQAAIRLKSLALPEGIIGYQATDGVQAGFGATVWRLRRKRGELRVGAAGKIMYRSGGYQFPTLTELLTLNSSTILANNHALGVGMGADVGTQFIYHASKNKLDLKAGLAMTDIGNTAFSSGADPQLSNLSFGLAATLNSRDMQATLAYDYAHILDNTDWRKRNHLGLELKFPVLSLYAGMNQLSFCYGAALDLWIIRVNFVSYAEEQATVPGQDTESRMMVAATVKFEL
jgi:hypothetical protein